MKKTEIKDMSDDELREHLDTLRQTRRTGYDKDVKTRLKKRPTPNCLKNVDENLAALVLAELEKRNIKQ